MTMRPLMLMRPCTLVGLLAITRAVHRPIARLVPGMRLRRRPLLYGRGLLPLLGCGSITRMLARTLVMRFGRMRMRLGLGRTRRGTLETVIVHDGQGFARQLFDIAQ